MQAAQIASGYIMVERSTGVPSKKIDGEHHGRDHRHRVGFEQVGGHAGAIADIVADVVGDGRRVARVILGNAGFDLADEVGADVGALGEDAAAKSGENRDQRGAEAERHQGVDRSPVGGRVAERAGENAEIASDPEEREAGHQQAGHGARSGRRYRGRRRAIWSPPARCARSRAPRRSCR